MFVALTALSSRAAADADEAVARQLFEDGRRLLDEGRYSEACPKFEEGQRLFPGVGMKFNLADCYERSGRLASAWAAFLDAASLARAKGESDREAAARRRALGLENELGKVQLVVPAAALLPGLEVRRDGSLVGRGQWGTAMAADPGKHVIEATAPARKAWTTTVSLPPGANVIQVHVPLLELDPQASEQAKQASVRAVYDPNRGRAARTTGMIVGGLGLAGLAAGATFGLLALNRQGASQNHCYPGNVCDSVGVSLRSDAIGFANFATGALVGGGVLFAGGAVTLLVAPSAEKPPVSVAVGPAGVLASGTF